MYCSDNLSASVLEDDQVVRLGSGLRFLFFSFVAEYSPHVVGGSLSDPQEDDALANTSLLVFTYSMSNCRVCIVIELGVIGLELAQKKTGRCSITRGLAAQN